MREGWKYKKLDDCCEIEYGTRVVQKKDGGTIYPVYGGGGETFRMDKYNREDCMIVARFAMSPKCVRYVSGKFFLNDSGLSVKAGDDLVQEYLNHHILYYNDEIYHLGKGAAQRNLDVKSFRQLIISIPPKSLQEAIVSELDEINSLLALKREQLQKYDKLAQSLFYEMFGDPVENEKGWEVNTIDDIIEFEGGSQPDKSFFEFKKKEDNIRLIQIRDYKTDKFITYIPKNKARRFCSKDDIMIGRYGPPIFQILGGIEGAYNVALMKAVPKKGNKTFIRYFLKQECLLRYLEHFARRVAGQDGIQMDKLKNYPFPYPPLPLQQQFATRIEQIEEQKKQVTTAIERLETLLASRMQYWFE